MFQLAASADGSGASAPPPRPAPAASSPQPPAAPAAADGIAPSPASPPHDGHALRLGGGGDREDGGVRGDGGPHIAARAGEGPGGHDRSGSGASASSGARLSPGDFSALYQQHHRVLWCIAAAIVRDRDLAYDIVQEAAVIALGKLREFDPATSFTAWCGQIVRFVALNHRKKAVRSHIHATDPGVMAANAPAAPASTVADHRLDAALGTRLSDALDTLDETARACLLMKVVMDMGYREIAHALGIPEGTAMSHVHRSRQALRRILEKEKAAP